METRNYKWTLRNGGGKMICPRCGQRRFVPYVLAADGVTLAGAEFGRCDREQNCGYNRYPNKEIDATPCVTHKIEPQTPLRFYPAAVRVDVQTPLFDYVANTFGVSHALNIWKRYKIGRDGRRTLFWQIATDGTIRAGKTIPYNPNGHRDKNDPLPAMWAHKSRTFDGMHTGDKLQQCFFGEHLLKENPTAPVVIVESEKTAAVLSELSRGYVWLASGGSQGLKNEDKNKVLRGRDVWLCPDNGQYWNWKAIADTNGWRIFDQIEKAPIFEGCDILDLVENGALGADLLKNKRK